MKKIILSLLLLAGCTANQERRIAEKWAPFDRAHNLKIIRESLARPTQLFSIHLIPEGKGTYLLKANHLPVNERFFFASIDGITGAIELHNEFESLPDGTLKVIDLRGPRYEASLRVMAHESILVGKQIDYVLVRKKDCTHAVAPFSPFPLEAKGGRGEHISLLVTHPMLTRFSLQGTGFGPNELLQLIHRSGERSEKREIETDANGELVAQLNPTILGKLGGNASLTLVGQNRSIELEYPWGSHLENRTFSQQNTFPIYFVLNLPHERDSDPFINPFFCAN